MYFESGVREWCSRVVFESCVRMTSHKYKNCSHFLLDARRTNLKYQRVLEHRWLCVQIRNPDTIQSSFITIMLVQWVHMEGPEDYHLSSLLDFMKSLLVDFIRFFTTRVKKSGSTDLRQVIRVQVEERIRNPLRVFRSIWLDLRTGRRRKWWTDRVGWRTSLIIHIPLHSDWTVRFTRNRQIYLWPKGVGTWYVLHLLLHAQTHTRT